GGVRGVDGWGSAAGSTAAAFTVTSPLAAPVITAPFGSVTNPPTITWQAVSGALSYTLRIDDLTARVSYFVWQMGLTGTSFTATTLTPNHSYRAWVQGVDSNGGGPWSAANFSVVSPLAAPGILNPVGNPPTITWQAVTGATSYNLRIDDLTTGVSYAVWQPGLTGTSYVAATLTAGHSCRVWLQAVDANGGGPWSSF